MPETSTEWRKLTFTGTWFFEVSFPEILESENVATMFLNTLSTTTFQFYRIINWFYRKRPKIEKHMFAIYFIKGGQESKGRGPARSIALRVL